MKILKNEASLEFQFEFGKNWQQFIKGINENRIAEAEKSLQNMLSLRDLKGRRFLDIGSGSGLFSLAARRLGGSVYSFDYDPESVKCTRELKNRYFPEVVDWTIEKGSALNNEYLKKIGTYDIVYSWGVLHHTGEMWQALENIVPLINSGGKLFISIYNDQGWISDYWRNIKRAYNKNIVLKCLIIMIHMPYLLFGRFLARALTGRFKIDRGMSLWYDMKDWLGGYPFEVAKPEEISDYFRNKGFILEKLKTCGRRMGCNEFVFKKVCEEKQG